MRVIVDTNILVSFAIHPSRDLERLFDYLAAHGITLISEETIAELFSVLSRDVFRAYVPQAKAIEYVEWYAAISEMVGVTEHVIACRDPKDDKFLSLAVKGKADCIISGDSDLLEMVAYRGVPVYRASEFLKMFADSK
jgi:putative PIN family toxin of toxin-antitoxin system